jgi:SAM-dependent methyltransferase
MFDREDIKRYCQINRAAWEEVTPKHRLAEQKQLSAARLAEPETLLLDEILESSLEKIGVAGRDVVHFCCNDGEELISIKKMGAGRCIGIDICEGAIIAAKELSGRLKLDCEFIQRNVYELPSDFGSVADLALITVGTLLWMPDLPSFFEIVSRALRPNGIFLIHEEHPFSYILDGKCRINPEWPYFNPGPYFGVGELDYFEREPYGNCEACSFNHTMSTVINSLIANGLQIESLEEYPDDNACLLDRDVVNQLGLPLTCSIIARKGVVR